MSKSKKQIEFEKIEALAATYKRFADQELINFINRPFAAIEKKYKVAVNNEIKRRGLKIK